MRAWMVLGLLLAASTVTGCLGGQEPVDAGAGVAQDGSEPLEGAGDATARDAVIPEPAVWTVGQYWTWRSETIGGEYSYVVTGEERGDWIVDTDSEQVAFFDARSDVSFLGEVRKSDLAGSQGQTRVEYFDWPLEVGKVWTTTWDGVERTIEVTAVEDGVARLEASEDGQLAVAYEYDASVGWFGDVTFYDGNGTATIAAELVDGGTGFTGEPVRWQLEPIEERTGTIGALPENWGGSFTVEDGATDVWLSATIDCPSGAVSFGLGKQDTSDGQGTLGPCPSEWSFTGPVAAEDPSGMWSYGMEASSPAEEGSYAITILVRTLETVPVEDS